mgnify:CR=1 FL=1
MVLVTTISCVLTASDGSGVSRIVYDPDTGWTPPPGMTLIPDPDGTVWQERSNQLPVIPDYNGFYQSLLTSSAYASIVQQEATAEFSKSLAIFVSAMSEANNGRANPNALQAAIYLMLGQVTLQPADLAQLKDLMMAYHLDKIYQIEPPMSEESMQ